MAKKAIALLATSALMLTACAGTVEEGAELPSEVIVGGITPLSGDAVGLGEPMQRAALMAEADINAAWADSGRTFSIQWEDGLCSGQGGASAAQKLINVDGMTLILGPTCSGETLAAAPIAEGNAVLVSPSASAPDVTEAGEYTFRTWPSDEVQGIRFAELAADLGYERVGVIYADTDYAGGIARVFEENFQGEVVSQSFLSDAVDYKTELTKLKNEEVDGILISPQTDVEADVILKQMQELGMEGPFILNDVVGTHQPTLEKYADFLEGSYTASFAIDEDSAEVQDFMARYEEMYGEEVSFLAYALSFYETTWMLAEAVMEVGTDATALQAHFADYPGHNGMTGVLKFDSNGDLDGGHAVFMIEGGQMVQQ